MFNFNEIFFMKRLKILIVKVAEFGNPSTKKKKKKKEKKKKTLTDRGTLLCVLKYFKSNETCLL